MNKIRNIFIIFVCIIFAVLVCLFFSKSENYITEDKLVKVPSWHSLLGHNAFEAMFWENSDPVIVCADARNSKFKWGVIKSGSKNTQWADIENVEKWEQVICHIDRRSEGEILTMVMAGESKYLSFKKYNASGNELRSARCDLGKDAVLIDSDFVATDKATGAFFIRRTQNGQYLEYVNIEKPGEIYKLSKDVYNFDIVKDNGELKIAQVNENNDIHFYKLDSRLQNAKSEKLWETLKMTDDANYLYLHMVNSRPQPSVIVVAETNIYNNVLMNGKWQKRTIPLRDWEETVAITDHNGAIYIFYKVPGEKKPPFLIIQEKPTAPWKKYSFEGCFSSFIFGSQLMVSEEGILYVLTAESNSEESKFQQLVLRTFELSDIIANAKELN